MRHVNELHKIMVVGILLFFICVKGVSAEIGVNRPVIQDEREQLERMLVKSSQVFIGRFDLGSVDNINSLKSDRPVKINFLIERHVKGIASLVDSIEIPIPYEFFMMRTKKGVDNFVARMLEYRKQFDRRKRAYIDGKLSKADWLACEAEWSKGFMDHREEHEYYVVIKGGLDMSFNPDVKYVLFLKNKFDGDYIDWKHSISYRTFSLGSGTFADLLLEKEE